LRLDQDEGVVPNAVVAAARPPSAHRWRRELWEASEPLTGHLRAELCWVGISIGGVWLNYVMKNGKRKHSWQHRSQSKVQSSHISMNDIGIKGPTPLTREPFWMNEYLARHRCQKVVSNNRRSMGHYCPARATKEGQKPPPSSLLSKTMP
jgi:hypothetical protein